MRELPPSLYAFAAYRQFIIYRVVPSASQPGKLDKWPCDFRTGEIKNAHDPSIWTDYATAIAVASQWGQGYGVGFVFTDADPFWFADLDHCLNADGTWMQHAIDICNYLRGAAVEISVSGTGLHLFGVGMPPVHKCESKYGIGGFYHTARFVALTGNGACGDASFNAEQLLPALIETYWKAEADQLDAAWSDGPREDWNGPEDDDELIRRMLRSSSTSAAFGSKASFADLWNENVEALSKFYPPDKSGAYNASLADSALAQHLAFWTGCDCERIRRLMLKSKLARDKWERDDYLPRTISRCVAVQFDVLKDKLPEAAGLIVAADSTETPKPQKVTGATFLNNEQQIDIFNGCVYVQDQHRALVPGGVMLKPDQFRVLFGGYTFTLDSANEKTTKDAWEAFTQNQSYRCPKATTTAFKPLLPPGSLITSGGHVYANTYWPVEVPRKIGDITPFLRHFEKLLPIQRDRNILLYYMAALVQYKGHKFPWAPVIQGTKGNGKTLLSHCVAEAIGKRYVHWPKASKLGNQFNGWMKDKLFYAVEDIYVPGHKADMLEELKTMITGGDGLEIENKGIDAVSMDICGNFLLNANTKGSVPTDDDERRYCIFHTAQQSAADIKRDGMHGDYFPKLYAWLRADGYAIVSELLHTLPIPDEYNPAGGCHRAPFTSSFDEAKKVSLGSIEQEVMEAIEQGLQGFCGGWISSIQLDHLLERVGANRRISHNKRKEMLERMGYVTHPALSDGRVNNKVLPDNAKPRLFIHRNSPDINIRNSTEAANAYEKANKSTLPFPLKEY